MVSFESAHLKREHVQRWCAVLGSRKHSSTEHDDTNTVSTATMFTIRHGIWYAVLACASSNEQAGENEIWGRIVDNQMAGIDHNIKREYVTGACLE